jgi:hypothetical protein
MFNPQISRKRERQTSRAISVTRDLFFWVRHHQMMTRKWLSIAPSSLAPPPSQL